MLIINGIFKFKLIHFSFDVGGGFLCGIFRSNVNKLYFFEGVDTIDGIGGF
jgi:hypothetical protein